MKKVIFLIIFVFSFAPLNSYAGMRCGNKLIQIGDSKGVIILTCGEPYYKTEGGIQRKGSSTTRGIIKKTGKNSARYKHSTRSRQVEDVIELWYYKRGYGKFIRILIFRNSLLEKIEFGPRQK